MSNYRIGDVIRLTRLCMGITQEQLCENICSVQTLHRIENGKTSVKKELYIKLMKKMERIPERSYAVCVGKDIELIEELEMYEMALQQGDYQKADHYLKRIKKKADGNLITNQFVLKGEAITDYYCNRSDGETTIRKLEKVIQLTLPNYKEYLDKKFPFTEQEIFCLISLANANAYIDRDEEAIKIYENLLDCLGMDYIAGDNIRHIRLVAMRNLAVIYCGCKMYEKAFKLNSECLKYAEENNEGLKMIELLSDKALIILRQISRGERESTDIDLAKQCLRQAYYLAVAKNNMSVAGILKKAYRKELNEEME